MRDSVQSRWYLLKERILFYASKMYFSFPKCATGVAGEDEVNLKWNKTYFMSNQTNQAPHIMASIYNNFYPVCKTVYLHVALSQCFDFSKSPCF